MNVGYITASVCFLLALIGFIIYSCYAQETRDMWFYLLGGWVGVMITNGTCAILKELE